MTETLQEYCDSRGVPVRVDRESGVIRGVKILGLKSRNGRTYLPAALLQAVPLYENAKVNVNHPKGHPAEPRDYQDRLGAIRNVVLREGEGLFADLCFNPRHALAEQLLWDAQHAPENVGFSHNVEACTAQRDGAVTVEAITRVQSVDLVADPATTRGLFEARAAQPSGGQPGALPPPRTVADLKRDYPALVEQLHAEIDAEMHRLQAEVDRLSAQQAVGEQQQRARRLLREFHLPEPEAADPQARLIVSQRFFDSLLAAQNEQAMRTLVEERARLVHCLGADSQGSGDQGRPLARDQYPLGRIDVKAFVEAITS